MNDDQMDLFAGDSPPPPPGRQGTGALAKPSPCGLTPPARHPARALLGACAWNHDDYRGWFYPAGLPPGKWLAYYAQFCNAVEVDSSFYRVPAPTTVRKWCDSVPEHFRFALKAPRSVTHDAMLTLEDRTARADWDAMTMVLREFGPALCSYLVQLSPRATILHFEALQRVMAECDPALPRVIEFRHPSWNRPEVTAWLRENGIVRAWADHYLDPRRRVEADAAELFAATGPFRFVRLLGDVSTKYVPGNKMGERAHQYGKRLFDRTEDLENWREVFGDEARRRTQLQIFVNNHYEGFSMLTLETLREHLLACEDSAT